MGEERGGVGEREESQRETHAGGEMKHSVFEDDDQHMMAHFWLGFLVQPLVGPGWASAAVGGTDAREQAGEGGVSSEERGAHPTTGAGETHPTSGERGAGGSPYCTHAGDQHTGVH